MATFTEMNRSGDSRYFLMFAEMSKRQKLRYFREYSDGNIEADAFRGAAGRGPAKRPGSLKTLCNAGMPVALILLRGREGGCGGLRGALPS